MSPSDYDHQCFQEKLSADIEYYRGSLVPDKSARPKPPGLLDELRARLNESRSALDSSKADRTFGLAYATSVWRLVDNSRHTPETTKKWTRINSTENDTSTKNDEKTLKELIGQQQMLPWYMDWALIEVSPHRQIDSYNFVPRSNDFHDLRATAYIRIDPERAYNVAKVGRTSGRTTGRINRIASVLNLRCDKSSIVPVDLVHRHKNIGLACGILSSRKDQDLKHHTSRIAASDVW